MFIQMCAGMEGMRISHLLRFVESGDINVEEIL